MAAQRKWHLDADGIIGPISREVFQTAANALEGAGTPRVEGSAVTVPAPAFTGSSSNVLLTNNLSYPVSIMVAPSLIQDDIQLRSSGHVLNFNKNKLEYKEGEPIFTLDDSSLDIEGKIRELKANLQTQEQTLQQAKSTGQTLQEIDHDQQLVLDLKQQLAQALETKELQVVRAPHDLRLIDPNSIYEGKYLSKDKHVLPFNYLHRYEIHFDAPSTNVYFNHLDFTLNGKKVQAVFNDWEPTPDDHINRLSFTVTTPFIVSLGDKFPLTGKYLIPLIKGQPCFIPLKVLKQIRSSSEK